jgi:hypothetical protein
MLNFYLTHVVYIHNMRPSLIGASINGLLILIILVYTVVFRSTMSNYERIILMSLMSIQIGIHSLLHHIEEIKYDFNPLEGKWYKEGKW